MQWQIQPISTLPPLPPTTSSPAAHHFLLSSTLFPHNYTGSCSLTRSTYMPAQTHTYLANVATHLSINSISCWGEGVGVWGRGESARKMEGLHTVKAALERYYIKRYCVLTDGR